MVGNRMCRPIGVWKMHCMVMKQNKALLRRYVSDCLLCFSLPHSNGKSSRYDHNNKITTKNGVWCWHDRCARCLWLVTKSVSSRDINQCVCSSSTRSIINDDHIKFATFTRRIRCMGRNCRQHPKRQTRKIRKKKSSEKNRWQCSPCFFCCFMTPVLRKQHERGELRMIILISTTRICKAACDKQNTRFHDTRRPQDIGYLGEYIVTHSINDNPLQIELNSSRVCVRAPAHALSERALIFHWLKSFVLSGRPWSFTRQIQEMRERSTEPKCIDNRRRLYSNGTRKNYLKVEITQSFERIQWVCRSILSASVPFAAK